MDPMIPDIKLDISHEAVHAKPRKLKVKWTHEASIEFISYTCFPSFWDKLFDLIEHMIDTLAGPGSWKKITHLLWWRWFPRKMLFDELCETPSDR